MEQLTIATNLPPMASVFIPPVLKDDMEAALSDDVHPAWKKLQKHGNHFVLQTNNLDDLTEVADWARTALVEPEKPLSKARRQAYQAVVNRTARWAVLEPLGDCHVLAVQWREGKLRGKFVVKGNGEMSWTMDKHN